MPLENNPILTDEDLKEGLSVMVYSHPLVQPIPYRYETGVIRRVADLDTSLPDYDLYPQLRAGVELDGFGEELIWFKAGHLKKLPF